MAGAATDRTAEGIRLAKRVAELKACSRREAELYIESGFVRVDGQVVDTPQFRVTHQTVELDANATLLSQAAVTVLLHKPPGVETRAAVHGLTATHRTKTDRSGTALLQRQLATLVCETPLESGASGLLVFTQDWRVLRKLKEDAAFIEHEVMVEVRGAVSPDTLQRLNRPLPARNHIPSAPPTAKVSQSSQKGDVTGLRFAIKGPREGQIADLCANAGLEIVAMKRIRIGRVALIGLGVGEWRFLGDAERV
jgi:23S rRNA pseudouridine2604 synthase